MSEDRSGHYKLLVGRMVAHERFAPGTIVHLDHEEATGLLDGGLVEVAKAPGDGHEASVAEASAAEHATPPEPSPSAPVLEERDDSSGPEVQAEPSAAPSTTAPSTANPSRAERRAARRAAADQ